MKRWLTAVMVAALALGPVACGKSGESGGQAQSSPAQSSPAQSSSGQGNAPSADAIAKATFKYDPAITLTTVAGLNANAAIFKQGETIEDNVHTRLIKERLGIDIKYNWVVTNTNDAYKTKLRLMLSSGEKMPDVVAYRGDMETVHLLIDSGQFMAVDELVEKYAHPEYKKGLALDPTIWYPITRDGKKMALPILDYAYNDNHVLWIREDWLKKLNLKAPETIDEMEKVMDAFVNGDPDGNGKKDTWGLAVGFKNGFNNWMTDIGFLFGAYGTMPGQWNLVNGKLEHGSINPAAKQALATLRRWMEKGYIPQDAAMKDEVQGAEYFTSGRAGMIVGRNWLPAWPFGDLEKNVPTAEYKAYPLPAGPDGKRGAAGGNPPVNGYLFINKDAKHPEAVLLYYNWFFENTANPKPGSEFEYGFAKGYDYAIAPDGTVIRSNTEAKKYPELFPGVDLNNSLPNPLFYTITYEGARIPTLYADALVKVANGGKPETPYEKAEIASRKPQNIYAMKVVMDYKDAVYKNYYTGPITDTMASKNELLNKLLNETYNKIIYGQAPLEAFDTMVQNWLKSGGEQITKEVNDWYAKVSQR